MVARLLLCFMILAAPALESGEAAPQVRPVSATAAPLEAFQPEPNGKLEDFFVVSLITLPFAALWSFIGATAVASVSQQKFPPEFTDPMLIGAGAVALGASVGVGLISVSFGRGKAARHPTLQPKKEAP